MNEGPDSGLLTVADAAARLGVTEQRLRRLLAREEYAPRTVTRTRRTRTGTRQARMLPEALVVEIGDALTSEENAPDAYTTGTDTGRAEGKQQRARHDAPNATGDMRLAALYERQLQDKNEEIAFLREQLALAQQNLSREQTLRALPAPAQNTPQEAPDAQNTGDRAEGGHSQPNTSAEGKKRGFFARLFGGKRNEAK